MEATVPTVDALLTAGGLMVIVVIVVEVILRAWKPSPELQDRVGPVVAIGVAILIGGSAALYLHADIFQAVITGIVVGFAAMGLHDTTKTVVG